MKFVPGPMTLKLIAKYDNLCLLNASVRGPVSPSREEFLDTSDSLVGCVHRFWTQPIVKSTVSYTPKYYCFHPGTLSKLSIIA